MTEKKRKNNNSWRDRLSHAGVLRILRRNVLLQASLTVITVVLTIILIFSLAVAWYTNVVQTGGLFFEAEQWNFDGQIEVLNSQSIVACPGGGGTIPLRVSNDGDRIVSASVAVNKENMEEEMRKRLYFYVDFSMEKQGELVDRVYISNKSSYTYTIFPHSELILSDSVQNGPMIRWMWVYDVLGYYVWGQNTDGQIVVSDYIRPIEYDYDPTTTTFDSEGRLLTVDGQKTLADFMTELTAEDGYAGTVNMEELSSSAVGGYYPVSVNGDGYGVWLYFCTADEIQDNMAYDTALGFAGTVTHMATVTVTGQNSREDFRPVSSIQDLQAALVDPTAGVIRLQDDLELTHSLELTEGTVSIDLNGKTLTVSDGVANVVTLAEGSKLSLSNGTLRGSGTNDSHVGVFMSGASLSMNDVIMENVGTGIRVEDNDSQGSSTLYINDCNLQAANQALWVYGNADTQHTRTRIVVENSTLLGAGYAGILFNGNYGGTDTEISSSIVTGYYTSIYHPQKNSTLAVTQGSVLSGFTGLVVKGGDVRVVDSVVHGTGEEIVEPAYSSSGWTDTGDGIYLEASYTETHADWPATVTVANSTVISDYGQSVRKYKAEALLASFIVESGEFTNYEKRNSLPDNFDTATHMEPYLADGSGVTVSTEDSKVCTVTGDE